MPSPDELAAVRARLDRLATRRRHPAAGSRLAALGLSVAATAGLAGYFVATGGAAPGAGTPVAAASVVATAPTPTTPTAPTGSTPTGR